MDPVVASHSSWLSPKILVTLSIAIVSLIIGVWNIRTTQKMKRVESKRSNFDRFYITLVVGLLDRLEQIDEGLQYLKMKSEEESDLEKIQGAHLDIEIVLNKLDKRLRHIETKINMNKRSWDFSSVISENRDNIDSEFDKILREYSIDNRDRFLYELNKNVNYMVDTLRERLSGINFF